MKIVLLAYNGYQLTKDTLLKRMKTHMDLDALIKKAYVRSFFDDSSRFSGCAVSCIAADNLKNKNSAVYKYASTVHPSIHTARDIYQEVDLLLNIPGIAIFIDYVHEHSPLDAKFSLKLLELLQLDVDYSDFIKGLIANLNKRVIACYRVKPPENLDEILSEPHSIDYGNFCSSCRRLVEEAYYDKHPENYKGINYSDKFLRYLRKYNKTHKRISFDSLGGKV